MPLAAADAHSLIREVQVAQREAAAASAASASTSHASSTRRSSSKSRQFSFPSISSLISRSRNRSRRISPPRDMYSRRRSRTRQFRTCFAAKTSSVSPTPAPAKPPHSSSRSSTRSSRTAHSASSSWSRRANSRSRSKRSSGALRITCASARSRVSAVPTSIRRSTCFAAIRTLSLVLPDVSKTSWSAACSTSRNSRRSCSTKRTACSTWVSSTT